MERRDFLVGAIGMSVGLILGETVLDAPEPVDGPPDVSPPVPNIACENPDTSSL